MARVHSRHRRFSNNSVLTHLFVSSIRRDECLVTTTYLRGVLVPTNVQVSVRFSCNCQTSTGCILACDFLAPRRHCRDESHAGAVGKEQLMCLYSESCRTYVTAKLT